jgi:hypothetical protein
MPKRVPGLSVAPKMCSFEAKGQKYAKV